MKRLMAMLAGLACLGVMAVPVGAAPSAAETVSGTGAGAPEAGRGPEMAAYIRALLRETQNPRQVAAKLAEKGARFLGQQVVIVSFGQSAEGTPVAVRSTTTSVNELFQVTTTSESRLPPEQEMEIQAGRKADFRLIQWLYEWRNSDGTYTEQNVTSGRWSDSEWRWMDNPDDVIDVRWVVGDLAYVAAHPFDGVTYDQHTLGVASFTVDDQICEWDLFVDFTPTGPGVYGKVTNVFTNYTHTWLGWRLSINLGAGANGSMGSVTIQTDARTWNKGTGLPIRIGSGEARGPAVSGRGEPTALSAF